MPKGTVFWKYLFKLLVFGQCGEAKKTSEKVPVKSEESKPILRTVIRVIDGDTVQLDGNEKVRLIGVDTPEKYTSDKLHRDSRESGQDEKMGEKASAFTKTLCLGKKVTLEFDREKVDRYGRILAYLRLEDSRVVNEEIIRQGYGHAYVKYVFKFMEKYRNLEKEAREAGRGLWGPNKEGKNVEVKSAKNDDAREISELKTDGKNK